MDPYEILGLSYPCSKEEIKTKYHELARKHHPDKHQHLSKEEIACHEQEFKKINVAYELLTKKEFEYTTKSDWQGIWKNLDFFTHPDLLKNMGDIIKNVIDITREYKKNKATEHHIIVDVTLEEIHLQREKKLRLFLKNVADPVFVTIDCGCYPSFLYTHITSEGRTLFIYITYQLLEHELFRIDPCLHTKDVYADIDITLYEYIMGCKKTITYLDKTTLEIEIPACSVEEISLPGKGLYGKGDLKVLPMVVLPRKEDIYSLDSKKLEKLQKYLKTLSNAPHSGHKI
jgi:DnaJ-class molecular chaperone